MSCILIILNLSAIDVRYRNSTNLGFPNPINENGYKQMSVKKPHRHAVLHSF